MTGITVHIPLTVRKRGGRKIIVAPDGTPWGPRRPQIDSTMVKALARAFRWRRMLESGTVGTVIEIATREKINPSYVSRVLRLMLLAPAIVEAILDGRQGVEVTLPGVMAGVEGVWGEHCHQLVGRDVSAVDHEKWTRHPGGNARRDPVM